MLEVEVYPDQAMHENQEMHGPDGRGNRRLASESTPVEQGQDFTTSTGPLDREEMSELSDISTEIVATRRSPTDNTMMAGGTEKQTTSSSFSERMKNTFGNIFPFTMGVGTGNEGESQEEEEDEDEQVDFGSRVSPNSSTQKNKAYTDRETGTMDIFGVVRTISKDTNTPDQSRDFVRMTISEIGPNSGASSTGNRQTSNERPTQGTHATGRGDSGNRRHVSPGNSHVGQGGNTHGDSDCRIAPNTEPLTRCDDTQAWHSRDATAMATAFEPLNKSLETYLTRLYRTNERSEKSRRVFKKQRRI